jgi:signal transduction histidine kinase
MLLINLLINAVRHNRENGTVKISIYNKTLAICNTGTSTPLHEKIFERFYKGDNNKTREGMGLGLAIAENICRLFGFNLTYRFEDGLHCFTVNFAVP